MVLTNGSREAREAILNIYMDPESGFQQLLDECSAKAKAATHNTHRNPTFGPFAVSQLVLFDMPNPNRFDILSILIFSKISLSISISISIFSRMSLSMSISISIFFKFADISQLFQIMVKIG